ncbi:MAG: PHP domain-containing protein, partial [Oscillospiraceae bacterium]
MTAAYPCDLHCHTTRSDGCDTPRELISNAAALGLKIIAITDHDVPPPETVEVNGTQIPVAAYAALKGISVLRGSEISCETEVEDVHLVVLGCDWGDPFFAQLEA